MYIIWYRIVVSAERVLLLNYIYETMSALAISRGYIQLRRADRLRLGSLPAKRERDSSRWDRYNNNIRTLYLFVYCKYYYHRSRPSDESLSRQL